MNAYDASHLRSLLASANLAAAFGEHELKRARERVALKFIEVTKGSEAAIEAGSLGAWFHMTEADWGIVVRDARKLIDDHQRAEFRNRPRTVADDAPYYVYTRLYKDNGDCEKLVHYFKTAAAQRRFIATTHRAVTNFN